MNNKRPLQTDWPGVRNSPPKHARLVATERYAYPAPKENGRDFEIPTTIALLRTKADEPWNVGYAIGVMLYHIKPILTQHLDNAFDYRNPHPKALSHVRDIVPALDAYIKHLRLTDGCAEKFPNDDRKGKIRRRKYIGRYTYMAEAAFKNHIRLALGDVFDGWSGKQTRLFNMGVDKAMTGIQWVVYPDSNVVIEAGEGDWAVWIRGQCEELGMDEARAGRVALQDLGSVTPQCTVI
ncbi:hypothetical protein HBI70_177440 [Parastagonospora nodorum]|nr:hypothetical protein HBH51_153910 [Parastagonospora nodorum]KAH4014487.1 hypothetical protein HBI09_211200 [Parastagonospora nodorum]KAH4999312.1 hypothetical protein HBI77_176860 [Parastagonospora nodorum]KAH5257713.1 hypothetical protein HBI70_177440 [Parastagonospora nodorum]KAH5498808.1 hypothetical protein HBI29_165740 [Parastagonospora nodorum]